MCGTGRKDSNHQKLRTLGGVLKISPVYSIQTKIGRELLGKVGHPGKSFRDSITMEILSIEHAGLHKIEELVAIGTVRTCPKYVPVPFKEEDLWKGYPEGTKAPYASAEKMLLVQSQAYRASYGFSSIFVIPVNLYRSGNNFDFETSHVISTRIRKCIEGNQRGDNKTVVWGEW